MILIPVSLDIIINRQSLASEAFTFMVPNGDPGGWNPLPDKTKLSKFNSFSLIKFVKVGIFSIKTWSTSCMCFDNEQFANIISNISLCKCFVKAGPTAMDNLLIQSNIAGSVSFLLAVYLEPDAKDAMLVVLMFGDSFDAAFAKISCTPALEVYDNPSLILSNIASK